MSMYNKKSIKDIDVKGKKCIVRCDFNVPMKDGYITSDKRIVAAMPTVRYLLDNGAAVILCSHMGKPHNVFNKELKLNKKEKAKIEALPAEEQAAATAEALAKAQKDVKKLSLAPVAERISELLGVKVKMAKDVVGPDAKKPVRFCCLRTSVSTRKRKRTTPRTPKNLLRWRRFTSTTHSEPRTERTLPPRVSPTICRRFADS